MTLRIYLLISGAIFGFVALAHLMRLITGWSAVIGGWEAPMLISWIGLAITAFLAVSAFRLRSQ